MAYSLPLQEIPETLGAVELTSIARGYLVADAMVKRAPLRVLDARAYCPGKFLIVVSGDVASVEEAVTLAAETAGPSLFGSILIPNLSPQVVGAINREIVLPDNPDAVETVGVVEAFSAVALIDGADAAVKAAEVTLQSVNLLEGLGGKAFMILAGLLTDVQTAVEAARSRIPDDMFVETQVIPQVTSDIVSFFPGRS